MSAIQMKLPTSTHCLDTGEQHAAPTVVEALGYSALSVGHAMLGTSSYALCSSLDMMAHNSHSRLGVAARLRLQGLSRKAASRSTESFHKSMVASASCDSPDSTNWASNLVVACAHFVSMVASVGGSTMMTDRVRELSNEHPTYLSDEQAIQELIASVTVLVNSIHAAYESTSDMRRILDTLERDEMNKLLVFAEGMNVRSDNDLHLAAQACVELVQNMVRTLRECVDRMGAVDSMVLPELAYSADQQYRLTATSSSRDEGPTDGRRQLASDVTADLSHIRRVDAMPCPAKESGQRDVHRLIDSTKTWVDAFVGCSNHYMEFRAYLTTYKTYLNIPALDLVLGTDRIHVDYEGLLAQLSRAAGLMRETTTSHRLYAHQITCLYNEMYDVVVRDQFTNLHAQQRGIDSVVREQNANEKAAERAQVQVDALQGKKYRREMVYTNVYKRMDPTTINQDVWSYDLVPLIENVVRDAAALTAKYTALHGSLNTFNDEPDLYGPGVIADIIEKWESGTGTDEADAIQQELDTIEAHTKVSLPTGDYTKLDANRRTIAEITDYLGSRPNHLFDFKLHDELVVAGFTTVGVAGVNFLVHDDASNPSNVTGPGTDFMATLQGPSVIDPGDVFFPALKAVIQAEKYDFELKNNNAPRPIMTKLMGLLDTLYQNFNSIVQTVSTTVIKDHKTELKSELASLAVEATVQIQALTGPQYLAKWQLELEDLTTLFQRDRDSNDQMLTQVKASLRNSTVLLRTTTEEDVRDILLHLDPLTGNPKTVSVNAEGTTEATSIPYLKSRVEYYEKSLQDSVSQMTVMSTFTAWFQEDIFDQYHKVLSEMQTTLEKTDQLLTRATIKKTSIEERKELLTGRAEVMQELLEDALARCQGSPETRKVQCRQAWLGSHVVLA